MADNDKFNSIFDEPLTDRKEYIKKAVDENRVESVTCPGHPTNGQCEGCLGHCTTYSIDGVELDLYEEDILENYILYLSCEEEKKLLVKLNNGEITQKEFSAFLEDRFRGSFPEDN